MTTPNLIEDLKRDEGCRLTAYPDPLSGGEPYTIGYGHTGGIRPGEVWTQAKADDTLARDISVVQTALDSQLPWWRTLDDLRQDVLVNMSFNLGVGGLLGFPATLAAIKAGDWQTAHDEMLDSKWAKQVGARATRLADQMLTGEHQP
jgi:lysozyme